MRKAFYSKLKARAQALLGVEDAGLRKYRKSYDREFTKKWKACTAKDLFSSLKKASIIFIGDFHALAQSQRAQLRVLRGTPGRQQKVLALECIEAKHQKTLQDYLKNKISEKTFLEKIKWQKNWGFSWANYKPLVDYAKAHRIPVFAINLQQRGRSAQSLKKRDEFAAKQLQTIRKHYPKAQIFVSFGDLHLAKAHLPKLLKNKNENVQVVLQNSEKIYFELLKKKKDFEVDVVRLDANTFCIQSVPPWVKWQNYLLHLEVLEGADSEATDEIAGMIQFLVKDLDLGKRFSLVDDIEIFTHADENFWERLEESGITGLEWAWVEAMASKNRSFYLPQLKIAFLAKTSGNHAASLATEILLSRLNRNQPLNLKMPDGFEELILRQAFIHFGAKLINPHRKALAMEDLKKSLFVDETAKRQEEVLRLALRQKMREVTGRGLGGSWKPAVYWEASLLLGSMLGEKMYHAYRQKRIRMPDVAGWIREATYAEVVRKLGRVPEPFISKQEKL